MRNGDQYIEKPFSTLTSFNEQREDREAHAENERRGKNEKKNE